MGEKYVLGKISEQKLVDKYASPAIKKSYATQGKLLTKNKKSLLEKVGRYCNIVDLGKREYEITEVYPYIVPANFKKMNTSLYQYICPLILDKIINGHDKTRKIDITIGKWATICDIYLINDAKEIIGRPILTVCIDAYSSLCCGYTLTLEGGIYSIRQLMSNVVSDKQEWCKEHNISIKKEEWNSSKCPGILVTDQGTEYTSSTFEQLAELGIKIVNLPVYRPELKGSVEKFFSIIQDLFRPYLKGKGVINQDFQERGAHDYRKDACLTLEQFEKILIRCILFYNTQRVLNNFPYTDNMLENRIQPYANNIFQYGLSLDGVNLIDINKEQIKLTLMPRTTGKFTRTGLIVNNVRYKNKNFSEQYLSNKEVSVAYNPDDSGYVWLINNGEYIKFELIESRFQNKNFKEIEEMKSIKKDIIRSVASEDLQARIGLGAYIETIANNSNRSNSNLQDIENNKIKEKQKIHKNYTEEVNTDE